MKPFTLALLTPTIALIFLLFQNQSRKDEIKSIHKDITNINEVLANHKYFVEQLIIMGVSNKLINIDTKSVTNK